MLHRTRFVDARRWFLVAALAFIAAPARPVVVATPGPVAAVNADPGDQTDPHVSGNIVVYTDTAGGIAEIRYQDLATGDASDRAIPSEGGRDSLPDVHGTRVVYQHLTAEGRAVRLFDLSDPLASPVELAPTSKPFRQQAAIGGSTVAWEDLGFGLSVRETEIVAHDLTTGVSTRLTEDGLWDRGPSVSTDGDTIAWVKCQLDGTGCDVYAAERTGGRWGAPVAATGSEGEETSATTDGGIIAYVSAGPGEPGESDIYWKAVGASAPNQLSLAGSDNNPNISGKLIAFEHRDLGATNRDIFVWDTVDGTIVRLTRTPELNEQLNDISVGPDGLVRVVWAVREADQNVYATSLRVAPRNEPPTVSAGGPYSVEEGGAVLLTATASDADGDALSFEWDLDGDGAFETPGAQVTFAAAGLDGPTSASAIVRVTDSSGSSATATAEVTVLNGAPTLSAVHAPAEPVLVVTPVDAQVAFSDPGVADTQVATWDWGDGTQSPGSVSESGGAGTAAGTHQYTVPGVYVVSVTVADDDGGEAQASFRYVVVFDASAGNAVGAGVFESPPGAVAAAPLLTGRAVFGFSTRFPQGSTTPAGNTRLVVPAAELRFDSTAYDYLVVAGQRAQFRGTGTLNGVPGHAFLVSVDDGVDALRVKVWEIATLRVVYDTQPGAEDNAVPAVPVTAGNLVITP